MRASRRSFVKAVGGATAAIAAFFGLAGRDFTLFTKAVAPSNGGKPRKWVMVIDLERCDGCKKCTEACINENLVPPTFGAEPSFQGFQEWIKVFELNHEEGAAHQHQEAGAHLPTPCMNCQNAPCVKVCPVGATFYSEDGIVLIDNTRCIGCRFCMAACPYERRFFNWGEPPHSAQEQLIEYDPRYPVPHRRGTVEKCMFCAHRVEKGRLPACVEACNKAGMKAIYFGDAFEDVVTNGSEVVRLSELLSRRGGYRLKEELGTKPRVYYLPPTGR